MIDINSNCSRVDSVKAQANQIKVQDAGSHPAGQADPKARKVKSDLQTLDAQIKAGDAKKAELALATAKLDLNAEKTAASKKNQDQTATASGRSGHLDVYA